MIPFEDISSTTIKYVLFIFNLILVVTGVTICTLGAIIKGVYTEFEIILNGHYYISASNLLIASGAFLFFIAFFGCCGAIKQNRGLLIMYSVLVTIVFIMELSAVITGYVLSDKTSDVLMKSLNTTMYEYEDNQGPKLLWDNIQNRWNCCGINSYKDWYPVLNKGNNGTNLPLSCCTSALKPHENCTVSTHENLVKNISCSNKVITEIENNAITIGSGALSVIIVQIIGILCSCYLAKSIRTSSYQSV